MAPTVEKPKPSNLRQILNAAVVVAALGYFVDIYDLVLFSMVRIQKACGRWALRA